MSPDTAFDYPSFNEVRQALQLESPAPEVAHEEAEASPSLHVEVEEEGAQGLGTRVQPPAPELSNTIADTQLDPASLMDTPMDAFTTLDLGMLGSSLEPVQEKRARGAAASQSRRDQPDTAGPR